MANGWGVNPLGQETITVCGKQYEIISVSFEVPHEQRPFGLMTPDDISINPERVLTLRLMPAAVHPKLAEAFAYDSVKMYDAKRIGQPLGLSNWMPPPAAPIPNVTATPATTEEVPRYFDLRLHEYKHWKDKLTVMWNGQDVSNMVVAAHAGESWVTLFTKDTKDVATDPLVVRRGKVTIGKKG